MKIWRDLRHLEFPSFYLELVVLEALSGRPIGQLEKNVWSTLNYIANNFLNARFVDPSNSNNIISDSLDLKAKQLIIATAKASLKATQWDQIVY